MIKKLLLLENKRLYYCQFLAPDFSKKTFTHLKNDNEINTWLFSDFKLWLDTYAPKTNERYNQTYYVESLSLVGQVFLDKLNWLKFYDEKELIKNEIYEGFYFIMNDTKKIYKLTIKYKGIYYFFYNCNMLTSLALNEIMEIAEEPGIIGYKYAFLSIMEGIHKETNISYFRKPTIASYAYAVLKKMSFEKIKKINMKRWLTYQKGYSGGVCAFNEDKQWEVINNVNYYDINSSYPSIMRLVPLKRIKKERIKNEQVAKLLIVKIYSLAPKSEYQFLSPAMPLKGKEKDNFCQTFNDALGAVTSYWEYEWNLLNKIYLINADIIEEEYFILSDTFAGFRK